MPTLRVQAAQVEARIDALLVNASAPTDPVVVAECPAGEALRRLDVALAMLASRLENNLLDGFAV